MNLDIFSEYTVDLILAYLSTYLFQCHCFHTYFTVVYWRIKKMISFKNFHLSENFIRIDSKMYQSGKDLNLEKWADPYDSDLLKFVTVLIYFVNVLACIVMVAFVVYETRGTQPDLSLFYFKSLLTRPQGYQGCRIFYI